jgi:hypothetical protein
MLADMRFAHVAKRMTFAFAFALICCSCCCVTAAPAPRIAALVVASSVPLALHTYNDETLLTHTSTRTCECGREGIEICESDRYVER